MKLSPVTCQESPVSTTRLFAANPNYVSEAPLKEALRITNYELRITNYELRITNY
ncbi:MAG: hypothetical protein F6K61_04885 [Sphaerospermopsis sp. SIO1G1]|nr:hypothetical protein [Sphaerospermopsis sp. SIO1G1]